MTQPPPDPFGHPVQPGPTSPAGPPQPSPLQPPAMPYPVYPVYPAYPGYQYGMPPHGGDPESSRTKAVWALVLAILPLCLTWIAAAVLAIIVLAGPRDGQKRGRGMAWWSLGIVAAWVVASVIAMIIAIGIGLASLGIDRDEDGNVTSRSEAWPEELRAGDCLDENVASPREGDDTETVVPCDEPHAAQVYLEIDLDSYRYPSADDIAETGAQCESEFESWVGIPLASSTLSVSYLYPSEDNWSYETTIKCVVVAPADVTESLEGSGR